MAFKKSAIGAALLGFIFAAVQNSPKYVIPRITGGSWNIFAQDGMPTLTLLVYQYTLAAVLFAVGVIGIFLFGYIMGEDVALISHYQRFVLSIGLGTLIGYLILIIILTAATGISANGEYMQLDFVFAIGRALSVPIQFGIIGFAGAAYSNITTKEIQSG